MVTMRWGSCRREHHNCIVEVASEFYDRGFDVYLEYEIEIPSNLGKKIVVDVYAEKDSHSFAVEIGTLAERESFQPDGRLRSLKQLLPNCRIIHVTQMKNFINSFDWEQAYEKWHYEKYIKPNEEKWIAEMADSLD